MPRKKAENTEQQESKKSRRRYGDGSIYERSDGRHVGSFYVDGQRRSVYGKTRAEAQRKLNEAKEKARTGELVPTNKQTVAQYLEYWLSIHKLEIREVTADRQASCVRRRMMPVLGTIRLQKLTTMHIQKWVNDMVEEGLEASTIKLYVKRVLNTALNNAVEQQLIGSNPCKRVVLPRIEEHEIQVLNEEQAQLLMHTSQGAPIETIVILALATAMRRGELLGLKWTDIDLGKGRIRIQRTLVYINKVGFRETEPKTKGSKRTITLAGFALTALKAHRQAQLKARSATSEWQDRDLVFCNKVGGYISFSSLDRQFRRLLEHAGLPHMHFHGLRHTCATLLLSKGTPVKVVQELLGHSSIKMTMDIYGHVLPGMQDNAMEMLHAILTHPAKKSSTII